MAQKDSSKGSPPTDQASFLAQDTPGIEVLKKALSENVAEGREVLGLFKSFYGEQEAKSLFDQVKTAYSRYLEDERPAFKRLATLERDRLRLENELNLAKKRYRYSSMSLEELAELVVKIEDQHLRNGLDFQQQGINLRGKQLFLLGGLNYTSQGQAVASGRAVSIDLDSMEVTSLPDLPTARSNASSTCIGPQVYVVGGSSDRGMTQAFEMYDTRSRRWEVLDNIPEELSSVQACTHQHNLVVWGKNKSQKTAIFMYETVRRKWGVIPSPPVMLPDHHDNSVYFKTCSQPQLGYVGSHLLSFERRGSQTALALYGLNNADPSWKKVDPCNKMQTIHQTLRQSHPDSQFKFLSAGSQTAIQTLLLGQGSSCTWIYDVLSGFRSKISDLEGHRLLAFAENVAVFRMDENTQSHLQPSCSKLSAAPSSSFCHSGAFFIRKAVASSNTMVHYSDSADEENNLDGDDNASAAVPAFKNFRCRRAMQSLSSLSVKQLTARLQEMGVDHSGCIEKTDLVKLLQEAEENTSSTESNSLSGATGTSFGAAGAGASTFGKSASLAFGTSAPSTFGTSVPSHDGRRDFGGHGSGTRGHGRGGGSGTLHSFSGLGSDLNGTNSYTPVQIMDDGGCRARMISISASIQYKNKSPEELRAEDYQSRQQRSRNSRNKKHRRKTQTPDPKSFGTPLFKAPARRSTTVSLEVAKKSVPALAPTPATTKREITMCIYIPSTRQRKYGILSLDDSRCGMGLQFAAEQSSVAIMGMGGSCVKRGPL